MTEPGSTNKTDNSGRPESAAEFRARMIREIRRPVPLQLLLYLGMQREHQSTREISQGIEAAGFRLSSDSLRRYLSALEDAGVMDTYRRPDFANTKPPKVYRLKWKR